MRLHDFAVPLIQQRTSNAISKAIFMTPHPLLRTLTLTLVCFVVGLLTGCQRDLDAGVHAQIDEARRLGPTESMRSIAILDAAASSAREACEREVKGSFFLTCARLYPTREVYDDLNEERTRYLIAALNRKEVAAVEYVFFSTFPWQDFTELRTATAKWLQSQLESQSLHDARLRRVAARVLADPGYGIPNSRHALALLHEAWLGGVPEAAGDAAALLLKLGDVPAAYMWSFRCLHDCKFRFPANAQQSLTVDVRLRAEETARDFRALDMSARQSPAPFASTTVATGRNDHGR